MFNTLLKKAFKKSVKTKLGYLMAKAGINDMKEVLDYKSTGGAMLLGVNGVVVKGHGSSDAYSFGCAMNVAYKMAKVNIVKLMKEGLEKNE